MQTPYVPHIFGEEVERMLRCRQGWLTVGVSTSISWPTSNVCVQYAGDEYFLLGTQQLGEKFPPGITLAHDGVFTGKNMMDFEEVLAKIYRFTSILSWFLGGYVDVTGWNHRPQVTGILNKCRVLSSLLDNEPPRVFNCNHMPIIENEPTRLALAFWREGIMLSGVHDGYAFLSFYKVIDSQFVNSKQKVDWISSAIKNISDDTVPLVGELRRKNIDVSRHLFESGRCAVAHASPLKEIIDPDIPADRDRLSKDLSIMKQLAQTYISDELKVPTFQYSTG